MSQTFFIYAPDNTAEGTRELRASVKEEHKVLAQQRIRDGVIRELIDMSLDCSKAHSNF
jgi:hypothetical protein